VREIIVVISPSVEVALADDAHPADEQEAAVTFESVLKRNLQFLVCVIQIFYEKPRR
jgi:hypothetical protein